MQLLQWMISLMTGTSGGTGGGGGTRLIPAIIGFMGPIRPRPGSNLWIHRDSVGQNANGQHKRFRCFIILQILNDKGELAFRDGLFVD